MAKNSVADWDTDPDNNTDIGGTNIGEGCASAGINNAIRKVMAQIKTKSTSSDTSIAQATPPGAVMAFARNSAPDGWLKANGAAVSRSTYAALFAAIGTTFGSGNGSTTFNLPDLRGEFVRGWADNRSVDTGRAFGSAQADEFEEHNHTASTNSTGAHTHTITVNSGGSHSHSASTGSAGAHTHDLAAGIRNTSLIAVGTGGTPRYVGNSEIGATASSGAHSHTVSVDSAGAHAHTASSASAGAHSHTVTVGDSGGGETRPRNIALLYCIKT